MAKVANLPHREAQLPPSRLLSLSDVCALIGRSRWWVRDAVNAGTFPKPISTGSRSPRWLETEIGDWIAALVAQRDGGGR